MQDCQPFRLSQPIPGSCSPRGKQRRRYAGFTLLELLVVLVIAGATLGMVSFNAMPSERQVLQKEAQRIAILLQMARDEAIVRNRPIAFQADLQGFAFVIREDKNWQVLTGDELLRQRQFQRPPISLTIDSSASRPGAAVRVVFGREPVDQPFVMTLVSGDHRASIRADGIGHFNVEQDG